MWITREMEGTISSSYEVTTNNESVTFATSTRKAGEPFGELIDGWSSAVRFYGTSIVTITGSISNLLALIVIANSKLRTMSTGVYMLALCITDTLVLISERLYSLIDPRLDYLVPGSRDACRTLAYLKYSSRMHSALLIVCINIERYSLVALPLKASRIANQRTAIWLVIGSLLFSLLATSYALPCLSFHPKAGCIVIFSYAKVYEYGSLIVDIGIGEVITSVAVLVLAILIVERLMYAKSRRESITSGSMRRKVEGQGKNSPNKALRHVTIMLLTVSLAFIFLRIPYTLVWIPRYINSTNPKFPHDRFLQALDVSYVIGLLNYGINFYLYCVSGRCFRRDMKKMCIKMKKKCKRKRRFEHIPLSVRFTKVTP